MQNLGFYQSGGAIGFRDQLQDSIGLKLLNPEVMKKQIIKHAHRQFIEGDVEHWWHEETNRGIRTKFSDDRLWLVYVTLKYIETTGDQEILNTEIPYLQGSKLPEDKDEDYDIHIQSDIKESLYKHCIRAIDASLKIGKNNLPLIGSGDWNDGFSSVGNKGIGESVWLGFFIFDILQKFIPIVKEQEDIELANKYEKVLELLKCSLNEQGWDGLWYRRAYMDDGNILGSAQNRECRIDSIAQSWSVISGAGKNEKERVAMESLEMNLINAADGIIKLLDPPFENSELEPGYIKSYLPGVRENGGQYTHSAIWAIMAFAILKQNDKAFKYFNMINPIEHSDSKEKIEKYKVEPFVISADVYGTSNLCGRGGWTWYTGSSSWYYVCGIEYILGLKIENGKLKMNPCVPNEWENYFLQYKYGNSIYNIKVRNLNKTNIVQKFLYNNEEIIEKEIKLQDNNKINEIEIII